MLIKRLLWALLKLLVVVMNMLLLRPNEVNWINKQDQMIEAHIVLDNIHNYFCQSKNLINFQRCKHVPIAIIHCMLPNSTIDFFMVVQVNIFSTNEIQLFEK